MLPRQIQRIATLHLIYLMGKSRGTHACGFGTGLHRLQLRLLSTRSHVAMGSALIGSAGTLP